MSPSSPFTIVVEPAKSAAEPAVREREIPEARIRHEPRAHGYADTALIGQRDSPPPASGRSPNDFPDQRGTKTRTLPGRTNPAAADLVHPVRNTLSDGSGDLRKPGIPSDFGALSQQNTEYSRRIDGS